MKLSFYGAAREVTGSCYLVETDQVRFLVDCGMFQGGREQRERNAKPFPFEPGKLDFVLLTHAHIDHSGLLPKLHLEGFNGPIYATRATCDLLAIMLPDSGHIQEFEAARAAHDRRKGRSDNGEQTPLYTVQDAEACLELLESVSYEQQVSPHPSISCRFRDAGHILGSSIIEIWVEEQGAKRKLVFSGDLGQPGRPILRDPVCIDEADTLVVESTYGNRLHKPMASTEDELVEAISRTLNEKNGNVIIPAFAVGRTQEIIYFLHKLSREGRLRDLNVFVDSPMATQVTEVTMQHMNIFDAEAKALARWHNSNSDHPSLPNLRFTESVEDSRALNMIRSGMIVISASGMCDAGRIKHHLRHNLGNHNNTILITGFQAQGTLGRRLVDGAESVKIFGDEIPVRAEIYTIGGLSAHADQTALMDWLGHFKQKPRQTFVVHGEETAAQTLAGRIGDDLGWSVKVPDSGESVTL